MDQDQLLARLQQTRVHARRWRRDRRNRRRAEALAALVEERLPLEYDVTGDHEAWPLLGAALLSRATSTLRHVFDAGRGGQSVDAATLGRSLYEHIVHFAWLAADPSPRASRSGARPTSRNA
jgi:hypothetical protein